MSAQQHCGSHSTAQRALRRRVSRLELGEGVRTAADALFRFTHRANSTHALWSENMTVWLGKKTFFHWAIHDSDVDIPWLVAKAIDAPLDSIQLRSAVRIELTEYWTRCLASLPRRSTQGWVPLP